MPCELCDRPAGDTYLCAPCQQDTADRLAALPRLFAALGTLLVPTRARTGGRSSTQTVAPTPADLDVIEARYGFGIVVSWCSALVLDLQLPAPTLPDDLAGRTTAACATLGEHLRQAVIDWPAVGDLAREIRDLHVDALTVTGAADLPARMGRCPADTAAGSCGAPLGLPEGQQVLHCSWCGATYPPGVWAALKVAQGRAFSPSAAEPAVRPSRASATAGSRG